MGPIWGRQDPSGPHVGPTNFAILDAFMSSIKSFSAEYQLNHWPLEDVEVILQVSFSNSFYESIFPVLPVKLVFL